MHVLIATGVYPPDVGGPATYSKMLADELPERGFKMRVVSFGAVRHLPFGIRHAVYFFKVLRAGSGADVIFAQDPVSTGLPAAIAAFLLRKRFVLKVVGDYAWEQGVQRCGVKHKIDTFSRRRGGYPWFVQLLKRIERQVALRAVRVIVPSSYLKKIVSNWGVPRERIVVIYNSAGSINIPAHRNVLRGVVRASGALVMSAGRFVPWKGFDGLIRMMPELSRTFPKIKLMIAGDGPERAYCERLAHKLGIEDKVIFLGELSKDVLFRYIKIADVFVLNSSYEGFSHQLLEVMVIGTPVVATNIGGNPEVVEHERSGVLVRRGDVQELVGAVRRVLEDASFRVSLARGAKRRAQDFSKERMLDATVELLKEIR